MKVAEEALSRLTDVVSIVRELKNELKRNEEKLQKQKKRNDALASKINRINSKLQNYDNTMSANERYREQLKAAKLKNNDLSSKLEFTNQRYERQTKELELEKEKAKRLEREIRNNKHDKPVKKNKVVKKQRSDHKTLDTPFKAVTKVGKREMVIGYFATSEMARKAEENAQNIL